MKKNKRQRGIVTVLIMLYGLFILLMVLISFISLFASALWLTGGNMGDINPYSLMDEAGDLGNVDAVLSLKGWIEELDHEGRVLAVTGEKKTPEMNYSPQKLFRLTAPNQQSKEEYLGILLERPDNSGYYLVIYSRKDVKVGNFTVLISSEGSRKDGNLVFLVLLFGLLLLLCMVMGFYLRAKINRPLKQLAGAMARVESGEEGFRLDFRTEAEFAQIRDAFNRMLDKLERTRGEKEKAEHHKNRMLLDLSHDIRTPIATISSYAHALEQGLVPAEKKQDYYRTIWMKAERVNTMADDMFMMLKMKSPEYEPELAEEDICEFLRRQCIQYYGEAQKQRLELTAEIPEGSIIQAADYRLLERVIGNLMGNALKYNRTGREINVSLMEGPDTLEIQIRDDGEPMGDGTQDQDIFDAFVRGDRTRRTDGGSGLGLTISRDIVMKHHGTISYYRRQDRNVFAVNLPRTGCFAGLKSK